MRVLLEIGKKHLLVKVTLGVESIINHLLYAFRDILQVSHFQLFYTLQMCNMTSFYFVFYLSFVI
ncbi:hypothetical protein DFH28DRAFT_960875 [Melampsora americana]|nr:hypothetical protein DFH28DRAFT_960875 [Melampsora americana]